MSYMEDRDLGAERVPRDWEDANSAKSRERWELERKQLAQLRKARREAKPLHTRLYDVMVQVASMPVVRAGNIAAQSRSSEHNGNMPHADEYEIGHFHADEIRRHITIIERALVALEDAAEVARYGSQATEQPMIAEEKDQRIRELTAEGLTPEQISQLDPSLGSVRVIEKVLEGLPV